MGTTDGAVNEEGMMLGRYRIGTFRIALTACAVGLMAAAAADARPSLRHVLRTAPRTVGLGGVDNERYQNAADALLENGVRNIPVHAMPGAAYTYQWQADCNCYKQVPVVMGPWFVTDRPEPVGPGLTTIGVTVGEYNMVDAYGCTFGEDKRRVRISAGTVDYRAGTELLYGVATLSLIHGFTDDLEMSTQIPFGWFDFGVNATAKGGTAGGFASSSEHFHVGPNIMDMMVRLKYRVFTSGPWTVSTGVRSRLPTGSATDGLGTGIGEIGPFALVGTSIGDVFGAYLDTGFDTAITDTSRSSAHYGTGFSIQPPLMSGWWHNVAFTLEFLGRSEIDDIRAKTSVSGPHAGGDCTYLCLDPSRQDYFDMTFGIRVRAWRSLVVSVGAFKPINEDDGVRARGFSPVGSIEATF